MITKEKLLIELKHLKCNGDTEGDHVTADNLLIEYINDKEIEKAFRKIHKWYA